ncbi:MAG: hypothetical protein EG823_09180 [Actinobacteria bacterium]|nr:hypothetical protein [Actinomycetota bacterium]
MDMMGYPYAAAAPRNDPQYIAFLEQRIRALEARAQTAIPNTKVVAQSFFTRAFAIWGHYFVAQFIIGLIVGAIMTVVSLIFAGSMAALVGSFADTMSNTGY